MATLPIYDRSGSQIGEYELDPAAIALGVLVLWVYRGDVSARPAIDQQRLQAKTGVALGLSAVVIGYVFVMTHKPLFTPVGV